MSSDSLLKDISGGERDVLLYLLDHEGLVPAGRIAEDSGAGVERVVSVLNSLSQKGIVELETIERKEYVLSKEGEEYCEKGLPEMRLLETLHRLGGRAPMDEVVGAAGLTGQARGIAIGWAKRNGWVAVGREEGKAMLFALTDSADSEVAVVLRAVRDGEAVDDCLDGALQQAIERGLVLVRTQKEFVARLKDDMRGWVRELGHEESGVIVDLTPELLMSGRWRGRTFKRYNMEIQPAFASYGKKHPYAEFNDWLREILIGLGFTEWYGPYVETEFWNNDSLFVPQDHVAREVQNQFRVARPYDHGLIPDREYYQAVKAVHEHGGDTGSTGWQSTYSKEVATRLCLRSHTTPVSMRYLYEHRTSPQKMFIIDRNFRAESLSASHAQEFNQCEGIIMDRGLTLRDLLGYLQEICRRVGIKKTKAKPGQFPFTEPSVEVFAKHETLGWIEVAPGGIFRPEVTRPLGITDTVLAWGIGSGRLYMAAMDISDIRELYTRDLNWLRRSYFVR